MVGSRSQDSPAGEEGLGQRPPSPPSRGWQRPAHQCPEFSAKFRIQFLSKLSLCLVGGEIQGWWNSPACHCLTAGATALGGGPECRSSPSSLATAGPLPLCPQASAVRLPQQVCDPKRGVWEPTQHCCLEHTHCVLWGGGESSVSSKSFCCFLSLTPGRLA